MRFVDSHLHLGNEDAPQALALASGSAILLLTCGVDRETSLAGLAYAQGHGQVRAFVGVHPSEVRGETNLGWLQGALERAAGAGEIGLDPKYSPVGQGSEQTKAFLAQLDAAVRLGKPVQIHSRDSAGECIDAAVAHGAKSALFHWFQDERRLRLVMDRGYFVSFGPSILYSKKLQRMASAAEKSLVLTETDAPVAYGPLGEAAGPSLIPSVVFKLAELWGVSFDEARETTVRNAARFLGASEKG